MSRSTHLGSLAFVVLVAGGCHDGSTGPAGKPLPPEYRILAKYLAEDLKPSPDDFRDNKSMAEHIAEGHAAIMALKGVQSSDPDIHYLAS